MSDHRDEIPLEQLTSEDLQGLLGELGQQLTVEQLKHLLALVQSSDDWDAAREALDRVERAA